MKKQDTSHSSNGSAWQFRVAEFVLPGHPDKLADAIADAVVAQARGKHPRALVGIEVALHRDTVFIDGRIACPDAAKINLRKLVREVFESAGYGEAFGPVPAKVKVRTDLCLGDLLEGEADFREVSDDQVIVTGYACSIPGTDHLPVEHALVRRLGAALWSLRL